MLTTQELTDARERLCQAKALVTGVRDLFFSGDDVSGAQLLNEVVLPQRSDLRETMRTFWKSPADGLIHGRYCDQAGRRRRCALGSSLSSWRL
jgi:hypothetical protein